MKTKQQHLDRLTANLTKAVKKNLSTKGLRVGGQSVDDVTASTVNTILATAAVLTGRAPANSLIGGQSLVDVTKTEFPELVKQTRDIYDGIHNSKTDNELEDLFNAMETGGTTEVNAVSKGGAKAAMAEIQNRLKV